MSISKIDLRTPKQRERDERNEKIYKEYQELIKALPKDTSKFSIWRLLAEKYDLQPQGIRTVVMKMESKNQKKDETTN